TEVPVWGTVKFTTQARFRENHAILSNQWFATGCVAFGEGKFAKMISGKSLIHKGLRDSARIV
ncbi:MAG TPA: hypothetical protein VK591_20190, partial [Xanthobacteraceae bacterium]|nr:hypothetical protein [Xanthobacteraceae bacterium]